MFCWESVKKVCKLAAQAVKNACLNTPDTTGMVLHLWNGVVSDKNNNHTT